MANSTGGVNWEKFAIGVLSIMLSGLGLWLWDIRTELTSVRRNLDGIEWAIKYVTGIQGQAELRAERLAKIEYRLDFVNDKLIIVNSRLSAVVQRQNKCKCEGVTGDYELQNLTIPTQ